MRLLLGSLLLLATACGSGGGGGGDGSNGPGHFDLDALVQSEAPASGVIRGPWAMQSATVTEESDGRFFLTLSDAPRAAPCDPFARDPADARRILASFAPATGTYDYTYDNGHLLTFTFKGDKPEDPPHNYIGPGRIVVGAISDKLVTGKIGIVYDTEPDTYKVSGTFSAKRCPKGPYKPDTDFPAEDIDEPRLLGEWHAAQNILGVPTDWTWIRTFTAPNTESVQLVTDYGETIEDGDEKWRFDPSVTPMRAIKEVTVSRKSINGLTRVGNRQYCIYEVAPKFRLECGYSQFPRSFTSDMQENYDRINP